MSYPPPIKTKIGPGRLFKIVGDKALVEFDYMYLVELPIQDVDLKGVDLASVEIEIVNVPILETPEIENIDISVFGERSDHNEGPVEKPARDRKRRR